MRRVEKDYDKFKTSVPLDVKLVYLLLAQATIRSSAVKRVLKVVSDIDDELVCPDETNAGEPRYGVG